MIVGAVVFAALGVGIFFVLGTTRDDNAEIVRTMSQWMNERISKRGHKEGEDFVIEKVMVLSRTEARAVVTVGVAYKQQQPPMEITYFEMTRGEGEGWQVGRHLHDDFAAFMKKPANQSEMSLRLAGRYSDRFQRRVDIDNAIDFSFSLGDKEGVVAAFLSTKPFTVEGVKDEKGERLVLTVIGDKKVDQALQIAVYRESFRFTEGEWKTEGPGQIFEIPR